MNGDNNPRRAFSETVSLVAWQTEFDGESGIADLFIDVVFDEGRVGGDLPSAVSFKLALRRAEVHVLRDAVSVLSFPAALVARGELVTGTKTTSVEKSGSAKASAGVSADSATLMLKAEGKLETAGALAVTEKSEVSERISSMDVTHRITDNGYAFVIRPRAGDRLKGSPWHADSRRAGVYDSGHKRKRGEPPAPRIEIHCRVEDLLIEDIKFLDGRIRPFWKLGRLKQIAIESYIALELSRAGLDLGSMENPLSVIVLADVSPERYEAAGAINV